MVYGLDASLSIQLGNSLKFLEASPTISVPYFKNNMAAVIAAMDTQSDR